jgi:hypothetical protein
MTGLTRCAHVDYCRIDRSSGKSSVLASWVLVDDQFLLFGPSHAAVY